MMKSLLFCFAIALLGLVFGMFLPSAKFRQNSDPIDNISSEQTLSRIEQKDGDKRVSIQEAMSRAGAFALEKKPVDIGDFEVLVKSKENRFSFLFSFEKSGLNDLFITVDKNTGEVESMPIY